MGASPEADRMRGGSARRTLADGALTSCELTAREAAFVADVGYDKVVKAFERAAVISSARRPRRRRLDLRGVFKLAVSERLKDFPVEVKRVIQSRVDEAVDLAADELVVADIRHTASLVETTFKASELCRQVKDRLAMLDRVRDLVTCVPTIQGGAPTFRGTRILVRHIAGLAAHRVARAEILEDFPELTDEMVELAVLYDRLYPPLGRPSTATLAATPDA